MLPRLRISGAKITGSNQVSAVHAVAPCPAPTVCNHRYFNLRFEYLWCNGQLIEPMQRCMYVPVAGVSGVNCTNCWNTLSGHRCHHFAGKMLCILSRASLQYIISVLHLENVIVSILKVCLFNKSI